MVDRAVLAVRTHREMNEVFKFIGRARGTAYAYGKQKLCYRTEDFSYRYCHAMTLLGKCCKNVTNKDVAWIAATFRSPDSIRTESKMRNRCLYYAVRILAQNAKKVVTTYDYLVSHSEILNKKEVAILDEAQTILNHLEEAILTVNGGFIDVISKTLKTSPETKQLAYAVRSAYRKSTNIHEFIDKLSTILSTYSGSESELLSVMDSIVSAYHRRRYVCDGKTYYFLTDSLPNLIKFEPKLMLGAYLPPMFLSTTKNVIRVSGEVKVKMTIDEDITSKYEERCEDTYLEYAKKLAKYVRGDVGNLAVFPSHQFMDEVLRRSPNLLGRVIRNPIDDEVKPGLVLVDVASGKYTEGVNLKGVGNVIICGMPYPEPNPILDLISKTYNFDAYTYLALLRTIQSVGRIRGKGTAYAIDKRYSIHKDKIPSWIELTS